MVATITAEVIVTDENVREPEEEETREEKSSA